MIVSRFVHTLVVAGIALALGASSAAAPTPAAKGGGVAKGRVKSGLSADLGAALEQPSLTWTTSSEAPWKVQTAVAVAGGSAAQPATIVDGKSTWLETSVFGPARISFSWKVSSEAYYDRLRFYVDGVLVDVTSGELDWARGTYYLSNGWHTARWEYAKDNTESVGSDTGYLDNIAVESTGYWRPALPDMRAGVAMATDTTRNKLVVYGGGADSDYYGDTWETDGSTWTRAATATGPGKRSEATVAYDSVRRKMVLFGGVHLSRGRLSDTWEWDGTNWTQVATTGPSANPARMVFSAAESRCLLYESTTGITWAWNGSVWSQTATAGPGQRWYPAMTYDSGRGKVVLFGGGSSDGLYYDDTWEWNGAAWNKVAQLGPEPRTAASLAYDPTRQRSVLVGGTGYSGTISGTWEWDGTKWTWMSATVPITPGDSPLCYLPSLTKCVIYHTTDSSLYAWDGATWTQYAITGPGARWNHTMAHDPLHSQTVLFGGNYDNYGYYALGDTWVWDGSKWGTTGATGPAARSYHTMSYQNSRGKTLLFGGVSWDTTNLVWTLYGDSWEWDGSAWAQVASAGPTARSQHAMCFDSVRNRVVMFGGRDAADATLGDTWEWDGGAWAQVATTGPSARYGHAMAFSPARQKTVMYGGYDPATGYSTETWEWNGTAWARYSVGGPTARAYHTTTYNADRGRIVMAGGYDATTYYQDTWEFDGTTSWTLVPYTGFGQRAGHAAAYDSKNKNIVMFGGSSLSYNDTWEYTTLEPTTPPSLAGVVGWILGEKDSDTQIGTLDRNADGVVDTSDVLKTSFSANRAVSYRRTR